MTLLLERLQSGTAIADSKGLPTSYFMTFIQTLCEALEANDAVQQDTIDALVAAQAAADAAQATADAAQATADAVKQTDAISASYTVPSTILAASDAGTNATITIAAHERRYGDGTTVAITGAALTGLDYSTLYAVYYDDPARSDTTPSFAATQDIEDAQFNVAPGRHFVGTITTPASGGGGTSGGGLPPGGGGEIP